MGIALFAAGLLVGAVVVGLIMLRRNARTAQESLRARADLDASERHAAERMADLQRSAEAQIALVTGNREQLADQMKSITSGVLKDATEQLGAAAKLAREAERQEIKQSLSPVTEHLKKVEAGVTKLELERRATHATVGQMVNDVKAQLGKLQTETGSLVSALKRPQVRGAWGEMQLRNCVEAANMTAHVDFESQLTVGNADDGRLRPDMVINQPGGKKIVVDAKVPLDAYLASLEGPEAERDAHLDRHAQQLRTHLQTLASKSYQSQFPTSPEFVVCFIPMEALYCAALDRDPALYEHWLARGVIIATPMTLVGFLHIVQFGWRQEQIETSARELASTTRELHKRMVTFLEPFAKVGRQLSSVMNAYNEATGSLDARVLPSLRRIEEHGAGSEKTIPALPRLDNPPRLVTAPELTPGDERDAA